MPMIDLETFKYGLLPVQQANASYHQAIADRREAETGGADVRPLLEAEKKAYDAYLEACMTLHGYVRGAVNIAEGRRAGQDE